MNDTDKSIDKLIASLQERAKELNCLYQIEEILRESEQPMDAICHRVVKVIPPGWQYPDICQAEIELDGQVYHNSDFIRTPWAQSADIVIQGIKIGAINVYYTKEMPEEDDGPFLKEETRLINTIAERLAHRIMYQQMRRIAKELESSRSSVNTEGEWPVVLKMLRQTDHALYLTVCRKMLNHLCWNGVREAEELMQRLGGGPQKPNGDITDDWNRPLRKQASNLPQDKAAISFHIAVDHLSSEEILRLLQKWIQEDKLSFLVQVVNRNLSLAEVAEAIRRYYQIAQDEPEIYSPSKVGINVSLIRRFLSDQLSYINIAKKFIGVNDFYRLLQNVIFTTESHGKLGGKSAGLYLATQILHKKGKENSLLQNVRIPKTWHVTSDVLLHYMHYNNFDEVVEQKYKSINQVRLEYPHIEQTFKNARFPSDIIKGLSMALDDFGDHPLIVRSSSLLEDRAGAAFSGKYKSLFIANQGTKQEKLDALSDAIAEVYASTFSPDPIEYRSERGLLDFGEEMGIMIQEVVGTRMGKYFVPSFAGVMFSNNEFRWSPRIDRKDGLVRLVPGLGTRAVDRLVDDYSILMAPGKPNLSVNVTPDEKVRYSPHYIDVINLETNSFETMKIKDFLQEVGYDYPGLKNIFSVMRDGHISRPLDIDFEKDELVATFEGLISETSFVKQMHAILENLEEILDYPVDVEFASDGRSFYLLQCRPQSRGQIDQAAPIPKDTPSRDIVFTGNRYISNGFVPDVTHIVYIDPFKYGEISTRDEMLRVGRAVSRLNQLLPKRKFILMGPGRWGSRGDIKLGVNVTYSDINNTAVLIEVARKKGSYVPDLSFGTHFFQDLVESQIRYLPLYPDDEKVMFNNTFLTRSKNILGEVAPEFADLSDVIYLIDVPGSASGRILKILMNADLDEAVAFLAAPTFGKETTDSKAKLVGTVPVDYWSWRLQMSEYIASKLDPEKYGVQAFYVFGSTKNASAGPGSDIDILIHFRGTARQQEDLISWLEGWSLALGRVNYLRTGYYAGGLLDVHIITDDDIKNKSSYAAKIGAVTDAARSLPVGGALED